MIQRNIWNIFYLILFFWCLLLGYLTYDVHHSIYEEAVIENRNLVKLSASSVNSTFQKYGMILEIISHRLSENDSPSLEQAYETITSIIQVDKTMKDIAIIRPNGEVFASALLGKTADNLMNLGKAIETSESFHKVLESKSIVVGRTYFNNHLKSLIVPIRKTVRNANGEPVFVLSSALNLYEAFKLILQHESDWELYNSYIYREEDRYFQLAPLNKRDSIEIYGYQIPYERVRDSIKDLEKRFGVKYEKIKSNQAPVSNELKLSTGESIATSIYMSQYGLWITTEMKKSNVNQVVLREVTKISLVLLISIFVIYILFLRIDHHQKAKVKALTKQANHDYLTKLNNRYYLDNNFMKISKLGSALITIDLDNFKAINDTFGHEVGDKVLIEVSKRIRLFVKGSGTAIRYSGDEFVVCTSIQDKRDLESYVTSLLDAIKVPILLDNYTFCITAKSGVVVSSNEGDTLDELKRRADFALYEAKGMRSSVVFYEKSIDEKYQRLGQIEYELKSALTNNELYIAYQPQCDFSGQVKGIEALARWTNPTLGSVRPDHFISVAESSGDILSIGSFLLQKAMKEVNEILMPNTLPISLSINISVIQLLSEGFREQLISSFQEYNDNPNVTVQLEVTESVFIENKTYVIELLSKLKNDGFLISLDDFGTGYSSLSLFEKLPLNELKLDKAFIDRVTESYRSEQMVHNIIMLAKSMGVKVVAEGVETKEQKLLLEKYGCDLFQGYLFSKPLDKESLKQYIECHSK
ncbi:bifunctional diguanylate cyclase/phosphodiesterase [Vibrio furnissii]|uniref:bifunctional diguanylate cyclase/phosphodiesterase n=1 Tax=Vibrio furnissii TaxID=29494 RepID=UPI0011D1214C|nr:EAL domain-containing protein [Vibrio furnissii]MCG6229581.1 EAL domain-containing protein [Vibrio furnissii]